MRFWESTWVSDRCDDRVSRLVKDGLFKTCLIEDLFIVGYSERRCCWHVYPVLFFIHLWQILQQSTLNTSIIVFLNGMPLLSICLIARIWWLRFPIAKIQILSIKKTSLRYGFRRRVKVFQHLGSFIFLQKFDHQQVVWNFVERCLTIKVSHTQISPILTKDLHDLELVIWTGYMQCGIMLITRLCIKVNLGCCLLTMLD